MSKREENILEIIESNMSDSDKVDSIRRLFKPKKQYDLSFDMFWNTYLDRIWSANMNISKAECKKKFVRMCELSSPEQIIQWLDIYLKANQFTEKMFIIRPRRFLEEKLFLTYIETSKEEKKEEVKVRRQWLCGYGNLHNVWEPCNCF